MIQVQGLSFRYPGTAMPVLENVSFAVGRGEVYGLLGPPAPASPPPSAS